MSSLEQALGAASRFKDEKGDEKAFSFIQLMNTMKVVPRAVWALLVFLLVAYFSHDSFFFRLYEGGWIQSNANVEYTPHSPYSSAGPEWKWSPLEEDDDKVCVVVRFGASQVTDETYNLVRTIDSIVSQTHTNWELVLIATDNGDISPARRLISSYDPMFSNRMRLYHLSWVLEKYDPAYKANFHAKVYRLTDYGMSKCSMDSRWVLVTNGDNTYHPSFLKYLNPSYDIIAYDFYSRWYMDDSSYEPCDRLAAIYADEAERLLDSTGQEFMTTKKLLSCLENHVRKAATDLGANAMNLRRWMSERRKYYAIDSSDGSQDGLMMNLLQVDGWKTLKIGGSYRHPETRMTIETRTGTDSGSSGGLNLNDAVEARAGEAHAAESGQETTNAVITECLFDHNPNYHSCLNLGPQWVWDDSSRDCITGEKAEALLAIGTHVKTTSPVDRCIRESGTRSY